MKENTLLQSLGINNSKNAQNFKGVSTLSITQGKALFDSLQIFSDPNSEALLKVTTPSIEEYYERFFEKTGKNLSSQNMSAAYSYIFSIHFRKCEKGEIYLNQINR